MSMMQTIKQESVRFKSNVVKANHPNASSATISVLSVILSIYQLSQQELSKEYYHRSMVITGVTINNVFRPKQKGNSNELQRSGMNYEVHQS